MLKALELYGFKSFADRTRFEFPAGITVIVGPNGSGKSNVVDAIKWVLGEQSAKSLRGREMSDVIFKGSGSGRRKPANTAEATIVFDNSDRNIQIDAPEVHVTRRVYRSGEGEYLVNGQACRLRDVKDLFRGTGVGADAYSLIEQGKVDMLLQASPRDRRAIFEEAAGISRFRAKKVETQRRLARVEQNLLRLSDIVEEVENRLKNVRAQANKARRYQEYTERLKQLRTETSRADWRRLTEQLATRREQLQQQSSQRQAVAEQLEEVERELAVVEAELLATNQQCSQAETEAARAQERIAGNLQRRAQDLQRLGDIEQQLLQAGQQWTQAEQRMQVLTVEQAETQARLHEAEQELAVLRAERDDRQSELDRLQRQLLERQAASHEQRQEHQELMRQRLQLGNRAGALETELEALTRRIEQGETHQKQVEQQLGDLQAELEGLEREEQRLAELAEQTSAAVEQTRRRLVAQQAETDRLRDQQIELRTQQTAAQARLKVLSELEQRQEGIGAAVRDVLARARDEALPPFSDALGMVADLVQVQVDLAPLLDVALGSSAQYIVLRGPELLEAIARDEYRPPGRVGFLLLESAVSAPPAEPEAWMSDPAVIGRADRFVRCDERFVALFQHLLGSTWLVQTLADARRLQSQSSRGGLRWVTRGGEMIRSDGTVLVGPRQSTIGIVSRRSQIAELLRQIERLERHLLEVGGELEASGQRLKALQDHLVGLGQQQDQAAAEYARQMIAVQTARQRRDHLRDSLEKQQAELAECQRQQQRVQQQRQELDAARAEMEARTLELERALEEGRAEAARLEAQRQAALDQFTRHQVQCATRQQAVEAIQQQQQRLAQQHRERLEASSHLEQQVRRLNEQLQQCQRNALQASSELAELYLVRERLEQQMLQQQAACRQLQARRGDCAEQAARLRQVSQELRDACHRLELAISQAEAERENLAQRVREDYGLDLAALAAELDGQEQQQRGEVDQEIEDLRRKIANIGPVNMEALSELEELEQRFGGLSAQYRDLVDAKETLEKIIDRINRDSRRLFGETLEMIRTNFQQLFRRVFGGGKADIVLEEGVDVLEAGIEIVATPPGKHSLSISLLSGGEKALTAVTLLLAIFQYRPSPFCVLDEVDGPLDEANIGRFIDVLKEFLQWTRFVIVTHSKKTMTAATTLYGVTMQESGVSKRVSVQFDDVTEEGHIRREALGKLDGGEDAQQEVA